MSPARLSSSWVGAVVVNRVTVARSLRGLLLAGYVMMVFAASMTIVIVLLGPAGRGVIAMSFVAAAVSAVGAEAVQHQIDRLIRRVVLRMPSTPYHALAAAAGRLQVGSWEQALPGLARRLPRALRHGMPPCGWRRTTTWSESRRGPPHWADRPYRRGPHGTSCPAGR